MKVKELIEELKELDPELLLIIQKDAEGNGFSPLVGVNGENSAYEADSTWSGRVVFRVLTPELENEGYDEGDAAQGDAVPCAVLWPTN